MATVRKISTQLSTTVAKTNPGFNCLDQEQTKRLDSMCQEVKKGQRCSQQQMMDLRSHFDGRFVEVLDSLKLKPMQLLLDRKIQYVNLHDS